METRTGYDVESGLGFRTYKSLFGDKGGLMYLLLYVLAIVVSVIPDYIKHKDNYSDRATNISAKM